MTDWQIWGSSVTGPLHQQQGIPNQDAWIARRYRWGHVLAVCDGLGSKPHSHLGSSAACAAVITAARCFQRHPQAGTEALLRLIHAHWLLNIAPLTASQCATTCLFAIHTAEKVIVGRLGDGAIAVYRAADEGCTLLCEDKQAAFSNLTASLHQAFKPELWQVAVFNPQEVSAVFLCSDGIADDILPTAFTAFIHEMYRQYAALTPRNVVSDLRRWMTAWPVPGHSDDKTLAGLCLIPEGAVQ